MDGWDASNKIPFWSDDPNAGDAGLELADDPGLLAGIMEDLKGRKFSNADIMDYCIPEAALLVGQGWIEDQVSFWQVSLSGARLYNLVKRISAEWSHSTRSDQRFAVLLVV